MNGAVSDDIVEARHVEGKPESDTIKSVTILERHHDTELSWVQIV